MCLPKSSIRVLVVDDYEPWRRFLRLTLLVLGKLEVVAEIFDGLEAVQKTQELQPDLILLDIGLPNLNGIEVARRIREVSPKSKILFVSEIRDPDTRRGSPANRCRRLCRQIGCRKRSITCSGSCPSG